MFDFGSLEYEYGVEPLYGLFKGLGSSALRSRLKVWIPDTIVFGHGKPFWLYTNANGYLEKTTKFEKDHIINKLGNRRFKDEVVVIAKRLKTKAKGAIVSQVQNATNVLSTSQLKKLLASDEHFSDKLIIQRYIKCKGSKAAIVRAQWNLGKPFRAWFISNGGRFDDSVTRSEDADERFVSSSDGKVNVFKLQGKACVQTSKETKTLLCYVENVLGSRLEELVVDYIKDMNGDMWFLQVKAYKLLNRMNKNRQGQKNSMLSTQTLFEKKCRFCMRSMEQEKTCYRMTAQMILETSRSLMSRLPRQNYNRMFGAQAGGDLDLTPSKLYRGHRVCKICYHQYHKENELSRVSLKFGELLGTVPAPQDTNQVASEQPSMNTKSLKSVTQDMSVYRLFIALHELHQLPVLSSSQQDSKWKIHTTLKMKLLDNSIVIPITKKMKRRDNGTPWICINEFRIIHFFTEEPENEPFSSVHSGIHMLIEEQKQIEIELVETIKGNNVAKTKVIGKCSVPLAQFKSSLVRNTTLVLPMGFKSELCQLRVSLGVERVHQKLNPDSLGNYSRRGGIIRASKGLSLSYPIPEEWLDALKSSPETAAKKVSIQANVLEASREALSSRGREELALYKENDQDQACCLQVEIKELRNLHKQELTLVHNLYVKYSFCGQSFISNVIPLMPDSTNLDFKYTKKHFINATEDCLREHMGVLKVLNVEVLTTMDPMESQIQQVLSGIVQVADKTGHKCVTRREVLEGLKMWESAQVKAKVEVAEFEMMRYLFRLLKELWGLRESALSGSVILDELIHLVIILNRLNNVYSVHKSDVPLLLRDLSSEVEYIFFPSHRCVYEGECCIRLIQESNKFIELLSSVELNDTNMLLLSEEGIWKVILDVLDGVCLYMVSNYDGDMDYEENYLEDLLMKMSNKNRKLYKFSISLSTLCNGQSSLDVTYQLNSERKHQTREKQLKGLNNTRNRLLWEYLFRQAEENIDSRVYIIDLTYTLDQLLDGTEDHHWFISEEECKHMLKTLEQLEAGEKDMITIKELLALEKFKAIAMEEKKPQHSAVALRWKASVFPTYVGAKLSLYPTKFSDPLSLLALC